MLPDPFSRVDGGRDTRLRVVHVHYRYYYACQMHHPLLYSQIIIMTHVHNTLRTGQQIYLIIGIVISTRNRSS